MGYSIVRFEQEAIIQWGVLKDQSIIPFAKGSVPLCMIVTDHLAEAQRINHTQQGNRVPIQSTRILSPVTRPTRILCLGLNYYEHREEAQAQHSKAPVFFRKDESAITGPYDDLPRPKGCKLLDYEVEMGLIIKKEINKPIQFSVDNIGDYVAGMILANDMSPRDLMFFNPFSQWYLGKSWRSMCPLGPNIYIFEEGEAKKMHDMEIKLWVNDDLRQDAHTKDMINKPEKALSVASEAVDLEPGDVFLTGTPGGVAIQAPSKFKQKIARLLISEKKIPGIMIKSQLKSGRFLKDGDIIRCSLKSSDGSINCGEQRSKIIK